jgi:TPR repeat protein
MAYHNLGLCYNNAEGVERNTARALELYKKSNRQEHPYAHNSIGSIYWNAEDIPRNAVLAGYHFRMASYLGLHFGQSNYFLTEQHILRNRSISLSAQI